MKWIRPEGMNYSRVKRHGGSIWIALPPWAWVPIDGTGCGCDFCAKGARAAWDTLVVSAEPPEKGRPDYATMCHYPEFAQVEGGR